MLGFPRFPLPNGDRFELFGPESRTIEAKCLFDADKLDCIGAIGVLRSAFVRFDHGRELFKEEMNIADYKRGNVSPDGRLSIFHNTRPVWSMS